MKQLKFFIFWVLIIYSTNVLSQPVLNLESVHNSGDSDRANDTWEKLTRIVPQSIGDSKIIFKTGKFQLNNYSAMYTGTATIVGVSDIVYRALYYSTDTLSYFQINFPASSNIKPPSFKGMNKLSPGWSSLYLPTFIRDKMVLDSCDIKFDNSGAGIESTYIGIKVLEDWQLFDAVDFKFSKIALGFITTYSNKDAKRTFNLAGNLTAYFKWKNTEVSFGSTLGKDIKDWVLTAELRTLSISDIMTLFHIDKYGANLLPPEIYSLLNQSIEKATLDIRPFKGIELLAMTSLGNLNLVIERMTVENKPMSTLLTGGYNPKPSAVTAKPATLDTMLTGGYVKPKPPPPPPSPPTTEETTYKPATETKGHKWGIMLGYSLPENFKFSTLCPSFSFLDKFQAFNMGLYYSTFDAAPQNSLPISRNLGAGNPTVSKGFTFIVGVNVASLREDFPVIKKLEMFPIVDFVCVTGNIPANPANFSLSAGINLSPETTIGGRVYFPYFEVGIEPNDNGGKAFSLWGFMNLILSKDNTLWFKAKAKFDPGELTASIGGAMMSEWRNAFGIKGFGFGQMELGAGINFSETPIPLPDNMSLAAKFYFGKMWGKARIGVDITSLGKNHFIGEVNNISFNNLIDYLFEEQVKIKFPKQLIPAFNSEIRNAAIKFVPPSAGTIRTLTDEILTPGFRIAGDGQILGWNGKFDLTLEGYESGMDAGIKAYCKADKINIKPGSFTVFSLTGVNGQDKPELKVDLTAGSIIKAAALLAANPDPSAKSLTAENSLVYLNAGLTILEVNNANAFIALTPNAYKCYLNGKILGFMEGTIDAAITDFRNPLEGTYVNGMASQSFIMQAQDMTKSIIKDLFGSRMANVFASIASKMLEIRSISFSGKLDGMKTGVSMKMVFSVAGKEYTTDINVDIKDIASFARKAAEKIKDIAVAGFNELMDAAEKIIAAVAEAARVAAENLRNAAVASYNFAKNTTEQALNAANNLKNKMTSVAQSAINNAKDGFNNAIEKTGQFFKDFGNYTQKTVEKIYNKSISQIKNGWESFTTSMKQAFTGADNEERIMADGPAFRVITKYQNQVLAATMNIKSNWPVIVRPRNNINNYLETWQLVPNDKNEEGSFFLVSGYNALLITKPRPTHIILIPHESDHKDRERMLMEQVPNDPGWYYLKFRDFNNNGYTYVEVKSVQITDLKDNPGFQANIPQTVLAPVFYPTNSRPGEMGKFKFEKVGDIDWVKAKNLPPPMVPAAPFAEGSRYKFNLQPEQYIYSAGKFRWIPDQETLVAGRFDAKPLIELPDNQRVSTVLGTPYPSRKDGILIQAQNDPAVYIMENGLRRWIPDLNTLSLMGLTISMVSSISIADLKEIPLGAQIPVNFKPSTALQEKALYQVTGDPTVYLVLNNTLRSIPDPETLGLMGYTFAQVQIISAQELTTLTKGAKLPVRTQNSLIQVTGKTETYMMDSGIRRLIPDPATFKVLQLDLNKIQKISQSDMDMIPLGPAILSMK